MTEFPSTWHEHCQYLACFSLSVSKNNIGQHLVWSILLCGFWLGLELGLGFGFGMFGSLTTCSLLNAEATIRKTWCNRSGCSPYLQFHLLQTQIYHQPHQPFRFLFLPLLLLRRFFTILAQRDIPCVYAFCLWRVMVNGVFSLSTRLTTPAIVPSRSSILSSSRFNFSSSLVSLHRATFNSNAVARFVP